MKKINLILQIFIYILFILNIECKIETKFSLNKTKELQQPKNKTVINLDNTGDTIIVPVKMIWDNSPEPEKGFPNIPKNTNEITKGINTIEADKDESLLFLDRLRGRIGRLSAEGKLLGFIGGPGSGPGELLDPFWMVYKNKKMFVSDIKSGKIQVYGNNGEFIRQINRFISGDQLYRFGISSNGEDIITRTMAGDSNLIAIYDSLGNIKKKFGNYFEQGYSAVQQLRFNDMFILSDDYDNSVWCFYANYPLIRKYNPDGEFIEEITFTGKIIDDYNKFTKEKDKENKKYGSISNISSNTPFYSSISIYKEYFFFNLPPIIGGFYSLKRSKNGKINLNTIKIHKAKKNEFDCIMYKMKIIDNYLYFCDFKSCIYRSTLKLNME